MERVFTQVTGEWGGTTRSCTYQGLSFVTSSLTLIRDVIIYFNAALLYKWGSRKLLQCGENRFHKYTLPELALMIALCHVVVPVPNKVVLRQTE